MVSKGNPSVTFEDVSSKVPDAAIVWHYLGVSHIPCCIKSPLRNDNKPSFGLYSTDAKRIYFTDFATGEKGGLYDLLSKMWHCSYSEVLSRVQRDLADCEGKADVSPVMPGNSVQINIRSSVSIEVKTRKWMPYDLEYWESYGIPLQWLQYADVYPISHKIVTKNGVRNVFSADKYAYAFVEYKESKVTVKIYQPFNREGYKWANTHDRSVISLWTKIPETGGRVVICSSLKDALCLWANTGIPALALQGEGYGMSSTAVSELKRRYKRVYILFDNDSAGIKDGRKLSEQTGFTNLVLPPFKGGKDVSDLMKCEGKEIFTETIGSLFNPPAVSGDIPDCPF